MAERDAVQKPSLPSHQGALSDVPLSRSALNPAPEMDPLARAVLQRKLLRRRQATAQANAATPQEAAAGAPSHTSVTATTQAPLAMLQDEVHHASTEQFHPEEIFGHSWLNPPKGETKPMMYKKLQNAHKEYKLREEALHKAQATKGGDPQAITHAKNKLDEAKRAFEKQKDFIANFALQGRLRGRERKGTPADGADPAFLRLKDMLSQAQKDRDAKRKEVKKLKARLKRLSKGAPTRTELQEKLDAAQKDSDSAESTVTTLQGKVQQRIAELKDEILTSTHSEPGHRAVSIFEPVRTQHTEHTVRFPDGHAVHLRDHVDAAYTVYPGGFDNKPQGNSASKRELDEALEKSKIPESARIILKMVSRFEGQADTINSYDKAIITAGFMQWAGAERSDLTGMLAHLKQTRPAVFKELLSDYGIDVEAGQLVVDKDGKRVKGNNAARAMHDDARLMAVLSHSGRHPEVQMAQIEAAFQQKIESLRKKEYKVPPAKTEDPVVMLTGEELIRSRALMAMLANQEVHSGGARSLLQRLLTRYAKSHPYLAEKRDEWLRSAEDYCTEQMKGEDKRNPQLAKLEGKY